MEMMATECKTTHKREPKSKPAEEDQTNEPSQSPTNSEKPSRNAEPEPVKEAAGKGSRTRPRPKYLAEKHEFKDLWRMLFPVGIEWDVLDVVYQYEWNFSNLEEALEEGGELHNKKVYLFAFTEAECLPDKDKIILVPVVVAVVSPIPPFDKIGIVEKLTEEIVPMEQMGFYWKPYKREAQVERLKHSQISILSRHKTGVGLINYRMIDRMKMFGSCIPYLCNPFQEDELEQSTVELVLRSHPNRVVCEFYLEQDKIEDITDTLIQNEELPADQKEHFKKYAKEKIFEAKKPSREARESAKRAWDELDQQSKAEFEDMYMDLQYFSKLHRKQDEIDVFTDELIEKKELPADQKEPFKIYARQKIYEAKHVARKSRKKAQDELGQESKAAFKNMEVYKFYPVPSPNTPDVPGVKSSFINRHCLKAHKVR